MNPEDLGQYRLASSVLGDDLDRWSEQRDQDLKTNYAAAGNTYNNTVYQTGGGKKKGLKKNPEFQQ